MKLKKEIMNKIYYIYEIWGKKIGCAVDLERRIKDQNAFKGGRYEVLEVHTDVILASQREIELQEQYGYKVDKIPYWKTLKWAEKAQTPQAQKKRVNNTDYKIVSAKRSISMDYKAMAAKKDYKAIAAKIDWKVVMAKRAANFDYKAKAIKCEKSVLQFDKQGNFIKQWDSIKKASVVVNGCEGSIGNCLKGRCKTSGGYIWKYAN